jgi:hypothetical protein
MRIIAAVMTLVGVTACSPGPNYYSNEVDMAPPMAHMSDIKQRGVFVMNRHDEDGKITPVLCAEPSPDAMGAAAASIAAEASYKGELNARAAASFSETVANVGVRTQSIQLLRDGMYRICELYAAGALGKDDVSIMQRRYQANMIALLAVEQLTGTVRMPSVVLTGQSSASVLNDIAKKIKERNEAVETKANLKKEYDALEGKDDAESKAKQEQLAKDMSALDAQIAELTQQIDAGSSLITNAIADGKIEQISGGTGPDAQSIGAVAGTVGHIANAILNADYSGQLCFEHLTGGSKKKLDDTLINYCKTWFSKFARNMASGNDRMNKCTDEAIRLSKRGHDKRARALLELCWYGPSAHAGPSARRATPAPNTQRVETYPNNGQGPGVLSTPFELGTPN